MAVDEAGLERAATECAPSDVGWAADVGRFKALVKQLRLGGETTLHGQPLPNPQKEGFDDAVEKMFRAAAEQSASQPLVQGQGAVPEADGTMAGSPPLQLQQQAPAPAPPEPQSTTAGEARAAPAGEATGAPQPMEVEPPPAPAPTEAPPLLVPPLALPSLGPSQLVAELQRVIAAAPPLDEAAVERLLDRLVGLDLTAQKMQTSGAPPRRAPCPRTCTAHPACPNAYAARCPRPHVSLAAPCRRVQAGQ